MVTSGLETVFIGNPVDGQNDAIGSGEGVRSPGDAPEIAPVLTCSRLSLSSTSVLSSLSKLSINYDDLVER